MYSEIKKTRMIQMSAELTFAGLFKRKKRIHLHVDLLFVVLMMG